MGGDGGEREGRREEKGSSVSFFFYLVEAESISVCWNLVWEKKIFPGSCIAEESGQTKCSLNQYHHV